MKVGDLIYDTQTDRILGKATKVTKHQIYVKNDKISTRWAKVVEPGMLVNTTPKLTLLGALIVNIFIGALFVGGITAFGLLFLNSPVFAAITYVVLGVSICTVLGAFIKFLLK